MIGGGGDAATIARMPEVAFVMSASQPYPLRELAATLGHELQRQAVPSALHLGAFPEAQPSRVYVLLEPGGYVAAEGEAALPDDSVLRRTVLLCARPLPDPLPEPQLELLRRGGAVFALDQRSVVTLHRAGVAARLMRPGYSASLDHFDPAGPRPIDVMFLGAHTRRRAKYLARAAPVLARHNCLLQLSDATPAVGDTSSYRGESRWAFLAATKIALNLHCGERSELEWQRVLDAVHAGAVVVTEHSSAISPLVSGEHLLVASADSLPYVAEALLRDEERLARLRAQAYERLSAWIPFALPVSILRAAVVELVGEPTPAGASLGTLAGSPAPPGPPGPEPSPQPEPVPSPEPESQPAPAKRQSIELLDQSLAWAARRAPAVTVVTAAGHVPEPVAVTLTSLARSRLRDLELVVVDAAPGAEVRQAVREWMRQHPRVAARLVGAEEAGLGEARNIGVDFARAPFCLILDAGQELYPRCMDVLVGTLRAMPDAAFVYPMLEVTGDPEGFADAGGDYLLSFLGWDPARLARGAVVHAPYLVRTDHLRRLGGFTADPRLDGREDHDLWCRMADRGWRGQLVPQELARRPAPGSSQPGWARTKSARSVR